MSSDLPPPLDIPAPSSRNTSPSSSRSSLPHREPSSESSTTRLATPDEERGFDPTNPSSQLLTRPASRAASPSLSLHPRPDSSAPINRHARPSGDGGSRMSSSTPALLPPSGRGPGPSRFGALGGLGLRNDDGETGEDEAREEEGKRWTDRYGGSKSMFGGAAGGNQGFMRMIHALAQESNDYSDDEDDVAAEVEAEHPSSRPQMEHEHSNDSHSDSGSASSDESEPEMERDPTQPFALQPTFPSTPAPEGEPLATSHSSLSHSAVDSHTSSTDSSTGEPPSFLSPSAPTPIPGRGPLPSSSSSSSPTTSKEPASEQEGGDPLPDPLASSLHAIYRPIAARRRTMTGEPGEKVGVEGGYIREEEGVEDGVGEGENEVKEKNEEEEEKGRPRAGTGASRRSARTVQRRERLADKLGDVFGLQEAEVVVAEFPCWLFRSILLQGFLFCTTGHLAFYAYLHPREGKTLRSGALAARGQRTRRYYKHWFVLKDDAFSWFPSSTDPYFPDGVIDLHYCTSVESSIKHPMHFKVATAEKRWHFSADSVASRDEWVKALKKAVFRCQNEGESVKIAIPLETIIDIERSTNLEFAETIRVRVYDADEGYSIDEYWLSYFADLEGALEKMQEVLEKWRSEHPGERVVGEEGGGRVRDTTERVVETLEGAKVEAGPGPEATSSRLSSIITTAPRGRSSSPSRQHSKTPSWSSSLSSRLRLFPSSSSTLTTAPSSAPSAASPKPALDRLSASAATLKEDPSRRSGSSTPRLDDDDDEEAPPPPASRSSLDALRPTPTNLADDSSDQDSESHHRYPPSPSATAPTSSSSRPSSSLWNPIPAINRSLPTAPQWLKGPTTTGKKLLTGAAGLAAGGAGVGVKSGRRIVEVVSGSGSGGVKRSLARKEESADEKERRREAMSRSVWDDETVGRAEREEQERVATAAAEAVPSEEEVQEGEKVNEKFRRAFGLTEKEAVVAQFPAYLFRGLPIYGKIIVSTTFLCFKSSGPLAKTRMILPFSDIIGLSKHRSYRIGYSGLIVVIKGHEEVFFELSTSDRRDACMAQLEQQVEFVQRQLSEGKTPGDTKEHLEHMDLLNLAASQLSLDSSTEEDRERAIEQALYRTNSASRPAPENLPGQPPVMFCSTSSDFVTFRPEKSLRFTCLTIGSRGDVQPYIALCKGLMAEGHKCKIASHGEYRQWVEGHGIAFEEVGGDPAELMELMIAHDFFTVSFMKEAVGRFRGWLDDLLETTWKACQDTDVLIESPSAIAGYHIAEAMRIPYYRAFTMPWSRTRAYPHAFAVPEHKMGGGYNYMTYTMFDQIFWRATSGQVNRWRRNTLHVRSTNLEAMQQHKIPFLYNFSPVVIPPPLDWRENIHVTGYWWLDNPDDSNASKWEPPKDLLEFLDKAKAEFKKVVFVGFGSIIIPDPLEMTRVVSEAVEQADVYAIVAKGWSDRKSKDDSEETKREGEEQERKEAKLMHRDYIYNIKSIPHDWLFPRIDAAVHHGGAGTTGASLRAGLPTIIKPFFGDQHFYADRVATLGIGSAVRDMTVANLAEAIIKAVTDEKQISRAKLAGEAIRKEDGVGTAIECIYRDLEYARSLIPSTSKEYGAPLPAIDAAATEGSVPTPSSESTATAVEVPARPSTPSPPDAQEKPAPPTPSTPSHHERSTSSSRTNPSSDEGGWDVVSSSASAVSGRGDGDSTRWEDESVGTSGGVKSRSRSRTRVETEGEGGGGEGSGPRQGLTATLLSALGRKQE